MEALCNHRNNSNNSLSIDATVHSGNITSIDTAFKLFLLSICEGQFNAGFE